MYLFMKHRNVYKHTPCKSYTTKWELLGQHAKPGVYTLLPWWFNNFVCIYTQLSKLPPLHAVLESLHKAGVTFTIFDGVEIEPTNERLVCKATYLKSSSWSGMHCISHYQPEPPNLTLELVIYRYTHKHVHIICISV